MIFTFYSYKGGVGRSMALANVAQWLYLQGARVVMIDWHLEAPGLEAYFFADRAELEEVRSSPGLVDLVQHYRAAFQRHARQNPARREEIVKAALEGQTVRDYLRDVYRPSSSTAGRLMLLTAGARRADDRPRPAAVGPLAHYAREVAAATHRDPVTRDDDSDRRTFAAYAEAVQSINWTDFLRNSEGQAFMDWLRAQLLTPAEPGGRALADIVLVDSSTGVTEMGGVCTRAFADMIVAFCAPNEQNLDGSIRMARSMRTSPVEPMRGKRLDVILVPSRLDDRGDIADLRHFQGQFEEREREFPTRVFRFEDEKARHTFWPLRIPYAAEFSSTETLTFPVEGGRGRVVPIPDMQAAYTRLGAHLAAHAPFGSPLRRQLASALSRELPDLAPRVVLSYFEDGADVATRVRELLQRRGLDVGPDLTHHGSAGVATISIGETRALISVITPAAHASDTLRDELRFARQHGIFRALVLSNEAAPPSAPGSAVYRLSELEQLVSDLEQGRPVELAPNMTPPLPLGYVERREFGDALSRLLPAERADRIPHVALWGPGGQGKTVIAQAIGHHARVYDAFSGGILWLSMSEPANLMQELSRLHAALTGEPAHFKDEREAGARIAEHIAGRPVLLVLDDVVNASHVAPLRDLAKRACVITTRDYAVASALGAEVVPIGAMTPDEASALLGLPAGVDPAVVVQVADQMLRWPLVLGLARDRLASDMARGVAPGVALSSLQSRVERHGVAVFDPWVTEHQRVSTLVAASIRRLGPELERFGLPALIRLNQNQRVDTWAESWPVLNGGPPEEQRATLTQRLADLALLDQEGRPHATLARYLATSITATTAGSAAVSRPIKSAADRATNPDVAQVLATLRLGRVDDSALEVKRLVASLKDARYFGYARRYLALARRTRRLATELTPWLGQQHALCTYKDPDLPADTRLDRALRILDKADPLERSTSSETLGIAGAIHKTKWTLDGHRVHLERSLAYYRRGFRDGESRDVVRQRLAEDSGYTAINAAYVLDLLAGAGRDLPDAQRAALRAEARQLREEIVTTLLAVGRPKIDETGKPWWFLVTLAEACFGLGMGVAGPDESWYERARYWIREALATAHAPWEYEGFARQLSSIARLHYGNSLGDDAPAMRALRVLLTDEVAVESVQVGKVGLALSGGGFRAALFHIGVLAKLAEMDLLRRVEVLSCVSGGSIIGAYYYLEVKKLLEDTPDEKITAGDYVTLVRGIADRFLTGVQDDLRNRLLGDFSTNVRSMFVAADAQTRRLGDLLEIHLYSHAAGGTVPRGLAMRQLKIRPRGASADFTPKLDNWRRAAKVPILVLNATTLNTGHNWQFTASWMGEPPAAVNADIDVNDQLPRVYYEGDHQAPPAYRDVRLAHAVAASAAVPMLFPPLELPGLYEGHDVVQLSDGGIHDNQGIAGLLEQDCAVLLVSDACGQLQTTQAPARWRLSVGKRTNDVFMERVRGAEYRELVARVRAGLVQGLLFVHLNEGLDASVVRWIGSAEPAEPPDDPDVVIGAKEEWQPTSYGVPRAWQRRLARLRTDLDAFSDREAYALMWSGYQMTGYHVRRALPELVKGEPEVWPFQAVKDQPPREIEDALTLGDRLFGKVWHTSTSLRIVVWTSLVLAAFNVVGWTRLLIRPWLPWGWSGPGVGAEIGAGVATLLAPAAAVSTVGLSVWMLCKVIAKVRGRSGPVALWVLLAVLTPALKVHRKIVRPLYLERGAMKDRRAKKRARVALGAGIVVILVAGLGLLAATR